MKYEVQLMPSAEAEIEAAYLWLSRRNPEAAEAWYNGLVDACLALETFPERHPLAPESALFDQAIRQFLYGRRPHSYQQFSTMMRDLLFESSMCVTVLANILNSMNGEGCSARLFLPPMTRFV